MPSNDHKQVRKAIGSLLRSFRIRAGMTQEEVAREFGSDRVTISNYERAQRPVSVEDLVRLLDILRAPLLDFFRELGDARAPEMAHGDQEQLTEAEQRGKELLLRAFEEMRRGMRRGQGEE
jgi:transcriptional regulator with XRE-family HTH domain